jgi:hypothetical protein
VDPEEMATRPVDREDWRRGLVSGSASRRRTRETASGPRPAVLGWQAPAEMGLLRPSLENRLSPGVW